jgi:hypothetical protein
MNKRNFLKKHLKRKAQFLCQWIPSVLHHAPFVFLFLTFIKTSLYPCILLGFFHSGMQGPMSSENTILSSTRELAGLA